MQTLPLPFTFVSPLTEKQIGVFLDAKITHTTLPITIHLRAAEEKQKSFCRYIFTNKVTLWAASYSACVVYTKTIIHLSVGESGGYLPR